jgi:adenylosuccinate synthase
VASSNTLLPPIEHKRAGGVDIVLGIQWGDEGKGRVIDLLAKDYAIVARFGGGDNAGHSIEVGDRTSVPGR